MQLTPEDLAKLKTKEVANAIRKLHAGKTLTAAERALLAGAADLQTPGGGAIGYAKNWEELADALGITPRGLRDARDRFPDQPPDRADGRKEVAAWLEWMRRHGIKRADEAADPDEVPEERKTIRDWKEQREKLQCIKLEREIDRGDGKLLVAAELEEPLGATFVAVQNKLAQFPERVAPSVAGFTDVQEVIGILRAEIDADLTSLHEASYLAEVDALVADLPADAETTRLFSLVIFDGQDRGQLLQLVAHLTREVLRRIGRRAIAAARSLPVDPLHKVTGQVTDEAADDHAELKAALDSSPPIKGSTPAKRPAGKPRKGKSRARPSAAKPRRNPRKIKARR